MADTLQLFELADHLPVLSAPWVIQEQMEYSGLGTGEVLAAKLAPSRWAAQVSLQPVNRLVARSLQARLEALGGPIGNFYFASPTNLYPAKDPGGSILGLIKPTIDLVGTNNKSLSFKSLPARYQLTAGDMVAIDYGSQPVRRYLGRLTEDAIASANGTTAPIGIYPHFPAGITSGLIVNFIEPAAKVFVVPGTLQVPSTGNFPAITFEIVQRP